MSRGNTVATTSTRIGSLRCASVKSARESQLGQLPLGENPTASLLTTVNIREHSRGFPFTARAAEVFASVNFTLHSDRILKPHDCCENCHASQAKPHQNDSDPGPVRGGHPRPRSPGLGSSKAHPDLRRRNSGNFGRSLRADGRRRKAASDRRGRQVKPHLNIWDQKHSTWSKPTSASRPAAAAS